MKILLFNKKTDSVSLAKNILGGGMLKVSGILLFAMIAVYMFQISEMTRETYLVRTYNNEIKSVKEESRNDEYSFLKQNSLSRVESKIEDSDFERIEEVHYIEILEPHVAFK